VLDACPKHLHEEIHSRIMAVLHAPDRQTAQVLLTGILNDYANRAPRAMNILEAGIDDALAVLVYPEPLRRRLRTTNGVERLNEEIRRRERVIRIFPNRNSALRLIGALLIEQDEVWTSGKRYLNMAAYWEWKAAQQEPASAVPSPAA